MNLMALTAILASLAAASAASAASAPQDQQFMPMGVELWGGLKTGMSKGEVESLGKPKKFELVKDCRVQLNPHFRRDIVVGVSIVSQWTAAYNQCAEITKRSLVAKYGDSADISVESLPMRGQFLKERWLTEDLVISLAYSGSRLFHLSYEPRLVVKEAELIDNL